MIHDDPILSWAPGAPTTGGQRGVSGAEEARAGREPEHAVGRPRRRTAARIDECPRVSPRVRIASREFHDGAPKQRERGASS